MCPTRLAAIGLGITAVFVRFAAADPSASRPATATAPANPSAQPVVTRISLRIDGRTERAQYWLRMPPHYAPDQRPALLIVLHGTDDTARQMIDFWGALQTPVPVLLAAPQGVGKGWSEADLPTIRAMWTDLHDRIGFDDQRVLLAGFSAGGAMTFELLYKQKLPVTAVAALANYVPPRITAAEVTARRHIPVFYAVGMTDLNHERMRAGLEYLRSAGANVAIYRPSVGHMLDAQVTRQALNYLFDETRKRVDAALDNAAQDTDQAAAVVWLEATIAQSRWHESGVAQKAAQILNNREWSGKNDLNIAAEWATAGRQVDAAELLRKVEEGYGRGRLGREARARRETLESDPAVRDELNRREARRRDDQAMALYLAAQRSLSQNKHAEAAARCREVIGQYSDTPAAQRARRLLELLEARRIP